MIPTQKIERIERIERIKAAAIIMCIGAAYSCGPKNSISAGESPSVTIEAPASGFIQLQLPTQPNRPQEQAIKLALSNTGKADLKVTKIEWLAKPPRLHAFASQKRVNSCNTDCSSAVCIQTNSQDICVKTGFPSLPLVVRPSITEHITFYISQGNGELNCPAPLPDTPDEFNNDDYCGALRFETDANNDDTNINQGSGTIYFTKSALSGQILLNKTYLEFLDVKPGFSSTLQFSIENTGKSPLQITSIASTTHGQWLTIGGKLNTSIPPNGLEQYTLHIDIPEDVEPSSLDFTSNINISSSAINANVGQILVAVKTDAGAAPRIQVSKTHLQFDTVTEQEFDISNEGSATLTIDDFVFMPSSASKFYSLTIDGAPVATTSPVLKLQKAIDSNPMRHKKTLKVTFNRPAEQPDTSSLAKLILKVRQPSDQPAGQTKHIILLGDQGDVPMGELLPDIFTFSNDHEVQKGSFAIINHGTANLEVATFLPKAQIGSTDEFLLDASSALPLVIPPRSMREVELTFTPMNTTTNQASFTIESNYTDPSNSFFISASSKDAAGDLPVAKIKASFDMDTPAKVGERTSFSSSTSTPLESTKNTKWFLLAKPDGSAAYINATGAKIEFTPDTAGTYKIGASISADAVNDQETLEFTAE